MSFLTEKETKEFEYLNKKISSRKVYEWIKSQEKLKDVKIQYREIFDINNGQYAPLSQDIFPSDEHEFRRWVELMEKGGDTGYCSWDRLGLNDPCPFVIAENVPEEFQGYVGIHEIFEGKILPIATNSYQDHMFRASEMGSDIKLLTPPSIDAHRFASKIELANVFLRGEDFSLRYLNWAPDAYFQNADPYFFKDRQRTDMNVLELTVNFLETLGISQERWGKEFPWLKGR